MQDAKNKRVVEYYFWTSQNLETFVERFSDIIKRRLNNHGT